MPACECLRTARDKLSTMLAFADTCECPKESAGVFFAKIFCEKIKERAFFSCAPVKIILSLKMI